MNAFSKPESQRSSLPFVFFGTPSFSVIILDELEKAGLVPALVVTAPPKPAGRGLALTSSPVQKWAEERDVAIETPNDLTEKEFQNRLREIEAPVYVLAAYGKIIPESVLNIPVKGIVNVHPSLLPRYRGPSPIESQILANEVDIGVSLIKLDTRVDHGPLIAQETVEVQRPLPDSESLENKLAHEGGELLATTLPRYVRGELTPEEQDHSVATHTHKFTKEDAQIDLADEPLTSYLKIQAFKHRPRAFFYTKTAQGRVRVIPTQVSYSQTNGLTIERVIPEGMSEMSYADFLFRVRKESE